MSTTGAPTGLAAHLTHDVVVEGRIDETTAGHLRARLGQAMGGPASTVVLDVSGVTEMDGSGLRELVAVQAKLRASGRELALHRPSPPVTRLLAWNGLSGAFDPVQPVAPPAAA